MEDDEFLKSMSEMYIAKLPEKIQELEHQWKLICATWNNENFKVFHSLIHKFCGSSGSYGLMEMSDVLRELEIYVKALLHEDKPLSIQEAAVIHKLLEKVKAVADMSLSKRSTS